MTYDFVSVEHLNLTACLVNCGAQNELFLTEWCKTND